VFVRLPARVKEELSAHARQAAPDECCGMLVGRDFVIEESVRVRNIASMPATRYLVDPAEHIAINRRLRGSARSIVGAYHSHPASPPLPSERDRAEALYPEFVWMIVSLAGPGETLAAFRLAAGSFIEVPIVVED